METRDLGARKYLIAILLGCCVASNPSIAAQQLPPSGAKLYVVWGHSEAGGHDKLETAPALSHGAHIWAAKDNELTYDPPANTFGSKGPSPNNFFADEIIAEGKATDVVLLKCSGAKPGQDWRIGIQGSINSLSGCAKKVKYAVETWKLKLSGAVTYCCAGDALDEQKARNFPDNYQTFVSTFRSAVGDRSLPFVSALTPLTQSCNRAAAEVEIVKLLRSKQAETKIAGATWLDYDAVGLPRSCFHLKGAEQAELGRKMARAVQ